tara:strand:- start:2187 stop:2333 length:147 start_codon:yes stop_codon:yes gene_type:complete
MVKINIHNVQKEEIKLNKDTKNIGEVPNLDDDTNMVTLLTDEERQGIF